MYKCADGAYSAGILNAYLLFTSLTKNLVNWYYMISPFLKY